MEKQYDTIPSVFLNITEVCIQLEVNESFPRA